MNHCGAPDLPFFATVLWYLKQVGAVLIILVLILAPYTFLLIWNEIKASRQRGRKKIP